MSARAAGGGEGGGGMYGLAATASGGGEVDDGMYGPNSLWALTKDYHTARGKILDGDSKSETPSVSWDSREKHGKKHNVEDGSVHHMIMKYLETQPERMARCEDITARVPVVGTILEHYLREMRKQGICVHKGHKKGK